MKFLKWIVTLAAVAGASVAVSQKVKKEKAKKEELDEFLVPNQDEPIVYDVPSHTDDNMKEAIHSLENHEPQTKYFTFTVADADHAHTFQKAAAELDLSSSYDSEKQEVEIEYNGNFDDDDLNLLQVQLGEISLQAEATFKEMHD